MKWLGLVPEQPAELKWIDQERPEPVVGHYAGIGERGCLWVMRAVDHSADGTTTFVASTGSVDRVGDVIHQESWRLDAFDANPVILYEHSHPVVGRSLRHGLIEVNGWKSLATEVQWDTHASNPLGILAAHQHEAGFRQAVSVGFMPGTTQSRADLPADHPLFVDASVPRWRAGYLYTGSELLEVSSVAVPANRDALQLSMDARRAAEDGDFLAAARTLLRGMVGRRAEADILAELKRPEVKAAILGMVLGTSAKNNPGANPEKDQAPAWVKRS